MNLGPWEIGIIAAVVILLFGAKRLPELGKGLGSFLKNFKSGMKEVKNETEALQKKL